MSIQEHVILVNDRGMVIGTQEKYAAHTTQTPLHLAFSSRLFNAEGECLVTRRALSKSPPGVWTNSVCGHPQTGEKTEEAIIRRCRYEVGAEITAITPWPPSFATAKPILPGLWKMRFARYSRHVLPANCVLITKK